MDPYNVTLEGLRRKIVQKVSEYVQN